MTLDQAFDRLRELTQPGGTCCLHCTAALRVALVSLGPIAQDPDLSRQREFDEDEMMAEFRQLHAAHPAAPVCARHQKELEVAAS